MMNRKIISAILILALCFSLAISANAASVNFVEDDLTTQQTRQSSEPATEEWLVFDGADLLSNADEMELNEKLNRISQRHQAQLVVITVDSVGDAYIDDFLEDTYDGMGFGYGSRHDGVMLMVCMDLREYRILSNGFAGEAIDSGVIARIGDVIVSDLSSGDYADAFSKFADQCDYYLDGYLNGFPFNFGQNLLIALVVGIVVGLIVAYTLKAQLKSVRKQERADVYVKPGSMRVSVHHDIFLYRNIIRTKKESNSGGSSRSRSGSSRSTGGGSF